MSLWTAIANYVAGGPWGFTEAKQVKENVEFLGEVLVKEHTVNTGLDGADTAQGRHSSLDGDALNYNSGTRKLDVRYDNVTINIAADKLQIKNGADYARFIAGESVGLGGALGPTNINRVGNVSGLGDAAFPGGAHTTFQVRRNGGAGTGNYQIEIPTGTAVTDYLLNVMPYDNNYIYRVGLAAANQWAIFFIDDTGAAADTNWTFWVLDVS